MAFGSSEDVSAIKLLLLLAVMYGLVSALTYSVVHLKFVNPLGNDAPLDRFSEGRTIQHVRMLSQEIDGRQEGRPGLKKAAEYIKGQLEVLKDRASSNVRIEIEETTVSGSFNMLFLGHNIALGYRNHTNIIMSDCFGISFMIITAQTSLIPVAAPATISHQIMKRPDERIFCCFTNKLNLLSKPVAFMTLLFLSPFSPMGFLFESDRDQNHINAAYLDCWISSMVSKETDPSVLVNGHFDSPLGSPGAGDCGSCVASMLEIARLIVDSGWVPYRPVIFLFNGAEELFMLGSHGFMKTHKWRDTIGAFINVEASGTGGPDLVCQSGPSSWPSNVYAEAAIYPMANSAAEDVFPVIPGDTDYRIFSQDYGNIPGLDIIFLLGGYFYHTSSDTVERLLPGSIQARGENLFSIIKTFTNSSKLQNTYQTNYSVVTASTFNDERAVFFDYFSWFMIFYSRRVAKILHSIPIFFLVFRFTIGRSHSWSAALCDFIKGIFIHTVGIILAVVVPVVFSILRLLLSSQTMNWFANPYLAFLMFVPCALTGLLIPRIIWRRFPLSQDVSIVKTSEEALSDEASFWGGFGFYAILTMAYLVAGLSGGFVTFFVCASMLPAWIFFCLSVKFFGQRSLRSTMFYILPLVPCLAYSVYFGGFLVQFLIEKMGMMGSLPLPYGHYVPDIIVAAIIGIVTGWCTGPLMPICGHWLARSSILQFLLHLSVFGLALSSQFFPYTTSAPKRIVFQHTFHTAGSSQILESTYDFSVTDSNSLLFLFKHSPEVAKELNVTSEFSFESASFSKRNDWMAIFPVSFLFSNSLKFPAQKDDILKQYEYFPELSIQNPSLNSVKGPRRVHLELSLGSLQEVWVAVLNITGPLSSWSFADNLLPGTEIFGGGPQSYICRLSGPSDGNWTFWLEANSSEALRVDVAVLDQKLVDPMKRLKDLFPDWVDVTAYSSFMSSYIL